MENFQTLIYDYAASVMHQLADVFAKLLPVITEKLQRKWERQQRQPRFIAGDRNTVNKQDLIQ